MENIEKAIEAKLKLLEFTKEHEAAETGDLTPMERKRKTLERKVEEIHELKVKAQEIKFEQGCEVDAIREWSTQLEDRVAVYEKAIVDLSLASKSARDLETQKIKEHEQKLAAALREEKFEEEMKFEKLKFEQKLNYEKQIEEGRKLQSKEEFTTNSAAKLPKLVITKFKGTHADWPRFWGQFEAEIDKSGAPQVTKFSYLKELVDPKVRVLIDGLPFSIEGYQRAKNILQTKYGQESEIINAYVNNIISLPTLHSSNPNKISEFYEKLLQSVQALETMGKLREVNGYVRLTLDKLEGIRGDLVRTDDDWRDWKFPQLVEALRKWTERNPSKSKERNTEKSQLPSVRSANKSRSFQAKQTGANQAAPKPCVYCDSVNHKPSNCDKIISVSDRREYLAKNQLCYNYTGTNHKAAQCRCTITCQICNRRHHTSICDKPREHMLVATEKRSVIYPVVIVEGIKCRALLDTGAGSA